MRQEAERRAALQRAGHGSYSEISEGEFLEAVTKTENVVVHFYHRDFERCKIVDAHMEALCKRFLDARFIKISAPVSWESGWQLRAWQPAARSSTMSAPASNQPEALHAC
jgi:hypothetical protein